MFKSRYHKQPTVKREQDQIWLSEEVKFAGIVTQLIASGQPAKCVILAAHFPSTFRYLESLLRSAAVAYEPYSTPFEAARLSTPAEYQSTSRILLILAGILPTTMREQIPTTSGNVELDLIVVEHHPLPSQDDLILQFAQGLPYSSRLVFHEALDGPFLKRFGGDQVRLLMSNLNIPENESFSNPTLDKSIRAAQEKLSRRITQNLNADSPEQWFEMNQGT
jgi:hypothetical protein